MRHYFRTNVRGAGYSLCSFAPGDGVRQLPLDVQSERLPAGFLRAQQRIDTLLEQRPERLYLSASVNGKRALVVYGCRFGLPDEHGRPGLVLVHAVEGAAQQIEDLVSRVITLVSPDRIMATGRLVGDVAAGAATVDDLITALDRVAKTGPARQVLPPPGPPPFGSIVHDWGGAPLAWLAMTRAHSPLPGPWEIYDTILGDDRVATVSSAGPHPQILLSTYLGQAVRAAEPAPARPAEPPRPMPAPADQPTVPLPARTPLGRNAFRTRARLRVLAAAAVLAGVVAAGWVIVATPGATDTPAVAGTTTAPPSLLDSQLTLTAANPPAGTGPYLVYRRGDGRLFPQGACRSRAATEATYTCTNSHAPDRRHTYTALLIFADPPTTLVLDANRMSARGLERLPGDDTTPALQLTVSAP